MNPRNGDLLVLFAGRALQAASTLITVRVVTTLLGPTEIGRMNLVVSLVSLFALLLVGPVANYVARQSIEWKLEGQLPGALWRFGLFLGLVSLLSTVVVLGIASFVGIGTAINRGWLVGFVAANLFFSGVTTTFSTVINTIGHRIWFMFLVNLASWLGLAVAVILVLGRGVGAEHWLEGLLIGQVVAAVLTSGVIYTLAPRFGQKRLEPRAGPGFSVASAFTFSWPLVFATGFYWMQTNGYRFVLASVADVKTVGLFTTGLSLALAPMALFDTIFTEYYRPLFYKDIAYGNSTQTARAWNKYASAYFPCIVLVGVLIAASSPFLARILVSAEFQSVGWLAAWGALVECAFMAYATYVSLSFALLNTRLLIFPNVLGALVAWGATFVLARWQPLLGTAIALFLGMLVTMFVTGMSVKRELAICIPWRRLGIAILLALPLILVLMKIQETWKRPTLYQALLIMAVASLYVLSGLFIMARGWLYQTRVNATLEGSIDVR